MSELNVEENNIVMTFNESGELTGVGKSTGNAKVGIQTKIIDNPLILTDENKPKLIEQLKLKNKEKYEVNDAVIVKLVGNNNILYIPGFIVSGAGPYIVGVDKERTIINVDAKNIVLNRKLASGEQGWFFSDVVLGEVVKDGGDTKELNYDTYVERIDKIIPGSALITITGETSDKYTHMAFNLINNNDISENTAKFKSVVPYLFNKEENEKLAVSESKTVFGGKKSRKQKTRKNTMPLQFAPGAKRAYLKRRKSSRK
jgi:hypothetical protein